MKKPQKWSVILISAILLTACASRFEVSSGESTTSSSSSLVKESNRPSSTSSAKAEASSSMSEASSDAQASSSQETAASSSVTSPSQPASQAKEKTPVRKLLSVPPQQQEVWNYCAPTTVSMMLSARGVSVSQHQLAKEMGTYEPFGTHNRDAIRILNKHLFGYEAPTGQQAGYRIETVTDASANAQDLKLLKERIKRNIDDGYPMYYTFMAQQIYPGKKGEHNVVGIGYELTADGKDIAALYYLDPDKHVDDPVYGGLKKVTPQELIEAMVTCQEPNYAW